MADACGMQEMDWRRLLPQFHQLGLEGGVSLIDDTTVQMSGNSSASEVEMEQQEKSVDGSGFVGEIEERKLDECQSGVFNHCVKTESLEKSYPLINNETLSDMNSILWLGAERVGTPNDEFLLHKEALKKDLQTRLADLRSHLKKSGRKMFKGTTWSVFDSAFGSKHAKLTCNVDLEKRTRRRERGGFWVSQLRALSARCVHCARCH